MRTRALGQLATRDSATTVTEIRLGLYVDLSARSLWLYDYVETFSTEVQAIWLRKISAMSVIFLLNRYLMLLGIIAGMYEDAPGTGTITSCNYVLHAGFLCGVFSVACTNALFIMRLYAIYNENRWIAIVTSAPVLGRVAIDFWELKTIHATNAKVDVDESWSSRCTEQLLFHDPSIFYSMTAATACLALLFDTMVLVLTVWKTWHHVMEMRRLGRTGLMEVFLRDGSLYFLLAFIITVLQLSTNIISSMHDPDSTSYLGQISSIVNAFYDVTPNMLVNKLVLSLRIYRPPSDPILTNSPYDHEAASRIISDLEFAPDLASNEQKSSRILGNIGAPLDHGQWDYSYEVPRVGPPVGVIPNVNVDDVEMNYFTQHR